MNLPGGFNWLDVVLFCLLIIGLAIGYLQGLVRQLIGLAGFYAAAILGAQYYTYPEAAVRFVWSWLPPRPASGLSFILTFVGITLIINAIATAASRSTKWQLFPILDRLGGSLLGLLTMFLSIALCLPVLLFSLGDPWPAADSTRELIASGVADSRLVVVLDAAKPLILDALAPWLPGGLPSIFNL